MLFRSDAVGATIPVLNTIPGWELTGSLTASTKGSIILEKKKAVDAMRFTIDTRKNTSNTADATFIIPLATGTFSGYNLKFYWGDGTSSDTYTSGTSLTQAMLTKTYTTAGEYMVTISTTQTNDATKQIPYFNFYTYFRETNLNRLKLISMDSPILNITPTTHLANIFYNCTNLTSIVPGLFDKNIAATSFASAFYGCTSFKEIPAGLFDKIINVTSFSSTFYNCSGITSIPTGLFDKNTKVTSFSNVFRNLSITSIPTGLFNNNTAVIDFTSAFINCTKLTSVPTGLFDRNTAATTFNYTLQGCTILTSVPEGLFAKNTAAVNFSATFRYCTKLQLNPNIFCNEATEKATRFAGKTDRKSVV